MYEQNSIGSVFGAARDRVLDLHGGDEEGRMLQSPGLKTSGKFYAFVTATDVIVKLPRSRVSELISTGVGAPCSPRPGRPMKEWVQLADLDENSCLAYLLEAREFVSEITERSVE